MELLLVSFVAGMLTVLAPCVLPLLPIILGGSVADKNPWRPFVITFSLAVSIVVFTLLLKASTLLIDIPQSFWKTVSGGILLFFGFITLFPKIWDRIGILLGLNQKSHEGLQKAGQKKGLTGEIFLGAALGPVFATCSPTFFVILATVLPAGFFIGLLYLSVYALGLFIIMFLVAFFGQKFIAKARWATDKEGWFQKTLGVLFLLVGLAIITGADKKVESYLIDHGFGNTAFEDRILKGAKESFEEE